MTAQSEVKEFEFSEMRKRFEEASIEIIKSRQYRGARESDYREWLSNYAEENFVPKSDYEKLKEEVNRLHEKYDFQLLVKNNSRLEQELLLVKDSHKRQCELNTKAWDEVKNLQTLLGECEEAMSDLISMEILIYGRISNLHGGAIINLNNVLQKIKAARGGK